MKADLRPENWTRDLAISKHWISIIGTCTAVCVRGHVGKISSSMHQSLASQAVSSQAVNNYPHTKEHEVSLPYSRQLVTFSYPEPHQYSPYPDILIH